MNNKPSKKSIKEKYTYNKTPINNHPTSYDGGDEYKSLTNSRRLCSTNHNEKSTTHLQNAHNHLQSFTTKDKHIKSKDSKANRSISNRKKFGEGNQRKSSHADDSMEE
jgi:hypothetical protein